MTDLIIQLNGETIYFFINDGKAAIVVVSSRGIKVKRIKSFKPFFPLNFRSKKFWSFSAGGLF